MLVIVIGCVGFVAGAGFLATRTGASNAPLISITPNTLEFGTVWAREDFPWEIELRNSSDKPVDVLDLRTSCNCTSVQTMPLRIDAFSTARVQLTIDLINPEGSFGDSWHRNFFVDLLPVLKGRAPRLSETVQLSGRAEKLFKEMPLHLDFGDSIVVNTPVDTKEITLNSPADIANLSVILPDSEIAVIAEKVSTRMYRLKVTPDVNLPLGTFDRQVQLAATGLRMNQPVPVSLHIRGTVVQDTCASPPFFILGVLPVGEMVPLELAIHSRTGQAITAIRESSTSLADDVTFSIVTLEDAAALGPHRVRLLCHARHLGMQRLEYMLQISQSNNGHTSVEQLAVPISYFGTNATVK